MYGVVRGGWGDPTPYSIPSRAFIGLGRRRSFGYRFFVRHDVPPRSGALRGCAYGAFFAPEGISNSIKAGSMEVCEFKSLLNDLGMRIQGEGFSSAA